MAIGLPTSINRLIFPGGLTGQPVPTPNIPDPIPGIKTGTGSDYQDRGPSGTQPAQPTSIPSYGIGFATDGMQFYAAFVPEVAKANNINPSNQGQNALDTLKAGYFPGLGVAKPSRSQFSEGYTIPLQVFAASNTWQLAGPNDVNNGVRAKQPNQKYVSPFSSLPIPTRMPWDL